MAKEYIELEPGNEYGVISLNKTVFSTIAQNVICLLYTSPSPRDLSTSRMPSSA